MCLWICNTDYYRLQNTLRKEYNANNHSLTSPVGWDDFVNHVLMLRGGETFEGLPLTKREKEILDTAPSYTSSEDNIHRQKRMSWISPKRLWTAARNMLRFKRQSDELEDMGEHAEFKELDSIMDGSNTIEEDGKQLIDSAGWFGSEPSPPDIPPGKSWNKRSLRVWIGKVSPHHLCSFSALAL